jgi:hypothetical protein
MESGERQPNLVKLSEEEDLHLDEPWQDIRGLDVYDLEAARIGG